MQSKKLTGIHLIIILFIVIFTSGFNGGNTPYPPSFSHNIDENIAPPTINKPIYNCSKTIGYFGIKKNGKIILYIYNNINGWRKLKEHQDQYFGSGMISLNDMLVTDDILTAVQIVDDHRSAESDRVKVKSIPLVTGKQFELNVPEIVPPLYECQKVLKVINKLPGAKGIVESDEGKKWEYSTPWDTVWLWLPDPGVKYKTVTTFHWYHAMQSICPDQTQKSDWTVNEYVKGKLIDFEPPIIDEKASYIEGNDLCKVDNLVRGATLDIFAEEKNSNKDPIRVGNWIAYDPTGRFHIKPPYNSNYRYWVEATLCDIKKASPKSSPSNRIRKPKVMRPCIGDRYVTICDTVLGADVEVHVKGRGVVVNNVTGNGDCLTIAIGNKKKFAKGDEVWAIQSVNNILNTSDAVSVQDGAPAYQPESWKSSSSYGYALNYYGYVEPGNFGGKFPREADCSGLSEAVLADGLTEVPEEETCMGCSHKVALFIDPNGKVKWGNNWVENQHSIFYRLDSNDYWSCKFHLSGKITNRDGSGNKIGKKDLLKAKLQYKGDDYSFNFNTFCGYFCVDRKALPAGIKQGINRTPVPGWPSTGSSNNDESQKCENEGTPCQVHPSECDGRGEDWMVSGTIQCDKSGKSQCKPELGVNYCTQCGGVCGGCVGNSCSIEHLCSPRTECKSYGSRMECRPIGEACTQIKNFCWTKDEVGIPELGCIEQKGK